MRGAGGAIALAVGLAAALRLYPILCPYPGIESQEHYPRNAVVALASRNWKPFALHHGGGLLDALRALYTVRYAAGRVTGRFADRIDVVAAYARDPMPFILVGRVVIVAAALATVLGVGCMAAWLWGGAAGGAAALVLAVSFMHVRESLHVWPEVPMGGLALATAAAALSAARGHGIVLASALGGITIATKHSAFPIALPIVLAALAAPRRARRLLVAAAVGAVAFLALSPYVVLELRATLDVLALQARIMRTPGAGGLSLGTIVGAGLGWGPTALAAVGVAVAARRQPAETAILVSFPLTFLVLLARSTTLYARYAAALAPFVALFAGCGASLLGRWIVRSRPALGAALVAGAVAAAPLIQSATFVRLLAREDTRSQAGAWIAAHLPPGTPLTVPDAVPYLNPILPPDRARLQLEFPAFAAALVARGVGDPAQTYPTDYLRFFGVDTPASVHPQRIVVTAHHPVVAQALSIPPAFEDRLRAEGAQPLAEFAGVRGPVPAGVIYDPIDADYLPLTGAALIDRPGPTVTIWELPRR